MKAAPPTGLNPVDMTPGQRLAVVLRYLGLYQKQAGIALGYSENTMTAAVKRNRLPRQLPHKLHTLYAISPVWLLTGQGSMIVGEEGPAPSLSPPEGAHPELRAAQLLECCPVELKPDEWTDLVTLLLDMVARPHAYVATLQGARRLKLSQETDSKQIDCVLG